MRFTLSSGRSAHASFKSLLLTLVSAKSASLRVPPLGLPSLRGGAFARVVTLTAVDSLRHPALLPLTEPRRFEPGAAGGARPEPARGARGATRGPRA